MEALLEAEFIIIEWEDTPIPGDYPVGHEHHRHVIDIFNELNTRTYRIHARDNTRIETVIDKFYNRIKQDRDPKDRLTCNARCDGEADVDVFQYKALTLHEFVEQAKCSHYHWKFLGGSGGA